jgi:hypothetical protein
MADPKVEGALRDATTALADLARRWRAAEDYLKIPTLRAKHEVLTEQAADPNLWDDQDRARTVTTELGRAGVALEEFDGLGVRLTTEKCWSNSLENLSQRVTRRWWPN